MKCYCPSCQKESVLAINRRVEAYEIKGERIDVDVDYFQCLECGKEFDNPDPARDPQDLAYREYRVRMGMLQPEQIRAFRKLYDLSQRELSRLIGFGGATLSRYENGALQDESHDKLLQLIMLPANFIKIVAEDSLALETDKRYKLLSRLRADVQREEFMGLINQKGHYGEPNLLNGMRVVDLPRLAAVVKVLCCQIEVYKFKLARLLFYADFKHFKEHGLSITGLCYIRLPQGPAPERFEIILDRIIEQTPDLIIGDDPSIDNGGETIRCEEEPDRGVFSFSELQTMLQVEAFFRPFTSSRLKYFSLEEDACRQTKTSELISYEYARRLRI